MISAPVAVNKEKRKITIDITVQVAPCLFPVAVMWTKMNVFYWCVWLLLLYSTACQVRGNPPFVAVVW